MAFLQLPNPQLCGRNIKVDVASGERSGGDRGDRGSKRGGRGRGARGPGGGGGDKGDRDNLRGPNIRRDSRNALPDIDGSQFMGGRYSRSNSSMSNSSNIGGGGGEMRRHSSHVSTGMTRAASQGSVSGSGGDNAASGGPPKQRPSLKLAPRTKPLDETKTSGATSSIFGGAKPRDEKEWVNKKSVGSENAGGNVTSAMASLEVKDDDKTMPAEKIEPAVDGASNGPSAPAATKDAEPNEKGSTSDDKPTSADRDDASTNTVPSVSSHGNKGPSSPRRNNMERKGSRSGGGRNSNGDRSFNSNDRRGTNRRDSNRKSGSGRGGGGRGDRGGRGGRGDGNSGAGRSGRKPPSSNGNSGKVNTNAPKAAPAANGGGAVSASVPASTMPTKKESKAPPKKANSFAAFMDDSDED